MHIAGRPKIKTRYCPATTRYGAHMGQEVHLPPIAIAWFAGAYDRGRIEINACGMEPEQAVARARALLAKA